MTDTSKPMTQDMWIEYAKQKKAQAPTTIPMPEKVVEEAPPEETPQEKTTAMAMLIKVLGEADTLTPASLIHDVIQIMDKVRAEEFRRERLYLQRIQKLEEWVAEASASETQFINLVERLNELSQRVRYIETLMDITSDDPRPEETGELTPEVL
jgi:hypothetical protein